MERSDIATAQVIDTRFPESTSIVSSPTAPQQRLTPAPTDLWQSIRKVIELQNQAPPLQPVARDRPLPLSGSQERLWLLEQLKPGSATYNIPFAFRITGCLDLDVLEQSLNEIVKRHEALRTQFLMQDGQPVQVVVPAPTVSLSLSRFDLRSLPIPDRDVQLRYRMVVEAQHPFNLQTDLLLRASLIHLESQSYVLLLTAHHIAFDGWSEGVLFRELSQIYQAFSTAETSSLPLLPLQYADFAVWQRQWLQGEVFDTQLEFWQQQLDGLTAPTLPIDFPRMAALDARSDRQTLELSTPLTQALKQFSRHHRKTLFTTLLTAFQILLHSYSGQTDLFVCTPTANRNRAETKDLIGYFVNLLVLRTDLAGDPNLQTLLDRIHQTVTAAQAYQHLPLQQITQALNLHTPLSRVMFVLQNIARPAPELAGCSVTPLDIDNDAADFDLFLSWVEEAGTLRGVLKYNANLFKAATIAQLLERLQLLLEALVTNPERSLSDFLAALNLQPAPVPASLPPVAASSLPTPATVPTHVPTHVPTKPKDGLELQLLSIWEQVLGVQSITVTDNFFDLGGHSFLALRLFSEIETALNVRLPLSVLYQAATVEQLAALLRRDEWEIPWSSLVPIQAKGDQCPLFCVHGAGSNVLHYRSLSRYLGDNQPFYGLQPRGLDGKQTPCNRIEEMAANYLKEIRTIQPEGPYRLGGSSMGGMIALEMAEQLQQVGQTVELVVLFDTYGPNYRRPLSLPERLLYYAKILLNLSINAQSASANHHQQYVQERLKTLKKDLPLFRAIAPQSSNTATTAPSHNPSHNPGHNQLVKRANGEAARGYQPKPYAGRVILFRASDRSGGWVFDEALGWSQLLSQLEIDPVPGAHDSMFREPHVPVLAKKLSDRLRSL